MKTENSDYGLVQRVANTPARNRLELATRLVFITGDIAREETLETLRKTGAPCIEKPFSVRQFISVVESTMGRHAL